MEKSVVIKLIFGLKKGLNIEEVNQDLFDVVSSISNDSGYNQTHQPTIELLTHKYTGEEVLSVESSLCLCGKCGAVMPNEENLEAYFKKIWALPMPNGVTVERTEFRFMWDKETTTNGNSVVH